MKFFWLGIIISAPVWAASGEVSCPQKALARLDCRLRSGSHEILLLNESVAWHDGIWRAVDVMPLKGAGVEWEKASLEILHKRPLLQLWIWDTGVGESKVQSLHWFVLTPGQRELQVLAKGIVSKRRLNLEKETKSGAPLYIHDAVEKHDVRVLKNGELEWKLGREKKILKATPTPVEAPKQEEQKHGI